MPRKKKTDEEIEEPKHKALIEPEEPEGPVMVRVGSEMVPIEQTEMAYGLRRKKA